MKYKTEKTIYQLSTRPKRQGAPWSKEECAKLSAAWSLGQTVPELAHTHKRSYRAIVMQLQSLLGDEWKTWNPYLFSKVKMLEEKLSEILLRRQENVRQ